MELERLYLIETLSMYLIRAVFYTLLFYDNMESYASIGNINSLLTAVTCWKISVLSMGELFQ